MRDRDGIPIHGNARWPDVYLRAGELEDLIHKHMPTKVPDGTPQRLASGQMLHPHDLLFLMPVRGLVEGRNAGIVDTTRYFAAGRISVDDIIGAVSAVQGISIFRRYGETPEDRVLGLDPHHLRHVQNTELFRLGVSDAIITKAAFSYLEAEADGLHVTPYGFCLNSFTVDPCPKHLECFNGCRHLTRTEIDAERRALETLRARMQRKRCFQATALSGAGA